MGIRRLSREDAQDVDTEAAGPVSADVEKARLAVLACLGRARSSVARTLTSEFGRSISASCVLAMLRQRWLAPDYGMMC